MSGDAVSFYLFPGDAVDDLLDVESVDGVVFVEIVNSKSVLCLLVTNQNKRLPIMPSLGVASEKSDIM